MTPTAIAPPTRVDGKQSSSSSTEYRVRLRRLFGVQKQLRDSPAKRRVVRVGRRGGKTSAFATIAVEAFLQGKRVLYSAPTSEQTERFWVEVKQALVELIDAKIFHKNESLRLIEVPRSSARIRAKTAWNPDMLRGDNADLLMLDEWQLCDETMWTLVGAPMLLDTNGDAFFAYTPPSVGRMSGSRAQDPRHAAKLFRDASRDQTGRWAAFTATSHDNPYLSQEALSEITQDMTSLGYRQEILAEDIEEVLGALWTMKLIEASRVSSAPESLVQVVVSVDPSGTKSGDEAGIIVSGIDNRRHGYVIKDLSGHLSPNEWGMAVCNAYHEFKADCVVAEVNCGWDMVVTVLRGIDPSVPVYKAQASRGKDIRAMPVVALYERTLVHHVGVLGFLEKEQTEWVPGESRWSPGRLDALVHGLTFLMLQGRSGRYPRGKSLG